jgi:Zn finger protein HypA/HybF involved in hydrogenase expression
MHELPITESILKIALDGAGDRRVLGINLIIGRLSSNSRMSARSRSDDGRLTSTL